MSQRRASQVPSSSRQTRSQTRQNAGTQEENYISQILNETNEETQQQEQQQSQDNGMLSPSFQSPRMNRINFNQSGVGAGPSDHRESLGVPMSYDRYGGHRLSQISNSQEFRMRGDLPGMKIGRRSSIGFRNIQETIMEEGDGFEEDEPLDDRTIIWGTTITVKQVERRFCRFLNNFGQEDNIDAMQIGDDQQFSGKYMKVLKEIIKNEDNSLCIDSEDIFLYDRTLYNYFIQYPREVIPLCDPLVREAAEQIIELSIEEEMQNLQVVDDIQVKIYNLREVKVVRDLDPKDIDTLISIKGMVTRTSQIQPDMRFGVFQCEGCGEELRQECIGGALDQPDKCEQCNQKLSYRLVHNTSIFGNRQLVKMQESAEAIPEGETPHSVSLFVYDDLVDAAKPGDRITVTGIYRTQSVRENPRTRLLKSVFKNYIDIIHMETHELNTQQLHPLQNNNENDNDILDFENNNNQSQQQFYNVNNYIRQQMHTLEDEMYGMSQMPDLYQHLVDSLAPSIWGMEDVKKGVLCQLFGGTARKHAGGQVRGEINILLVGDPGVSKSQLLSHIHKIAPRGIYVSGQGSSAVGLTAYIARDPDTRETVLEPGALILSDEGVCCIDEFDKMNDSTRAMLHEVMEQQTVSVAKAGIISVLRARTSILAAANPVGSKYNKKLSVKENINLPPTLMSRFDLIYLLLDNYDKDNDFRLARHILSLWGQREIESEATRATFTRDQVREYISFAKARCHPKLTEEAAQYLAREYVGMRKRGSSRNAITATLRQLESLVRLSESLARMKLQNDVGTEECKEAVRLMNVSLMQSATDPETGMIDMGIIQAGKTETERQMERMLPTLIENVIKEIGVMKLVDLHEKLSTDSTVPISMNTLMEILRGMETVSYNASTGKVLPLDQ